MVALTALVLSVEILLVIAALVSRTPPAVDLTYVHSIVWHYQRNFQPQRNLFYYFLWMGLVTSLYACLWGAVRSSKKIAAIDFKPFVMLHFLVACLMCHATFEVVVMNNPVWAWPVFWGAFTAGLTASIFWSEFLSGMNFLKKRYASYHLSSWVGITLGCLFIFLVIFMPDLQAVVAMVYMGDYFHNWDVSYFGPVYAIARGLLPCIDVNVTYGFGASVMLAKLVDLMGGFDYSKLLGIVMWVGIIYFILWFLLLRRFLASGLLAFAAIVFAMRMQMFNSMIEPFIWVEIMHSVFRLCFDIGVFWMLWMHLQTRRTLYLAAAAFFVSLALYHMLQTGIYIFLVFMIYAGLSAFVPSLGGSRNTLLWRNNALAIGSVFIWTGLWFYMSVGTLFLSGDFYKSLVGYSSFFIKGAFEGPLTAALIRSNVESSFGGLLYPAFYMATLLYVAGKLTAGKAQKQDIFAGLLSFYGLELHSYYMLMVTQWYTVGFPGIFLLFYWLTKILVKIPAKWHQRITWGLVAASVYCLMTARLFTGYPNLLSFSRNPIVDERTAFRVGPKHVPYFHQLFADFPDAFKLPVNSLGEKDEALKFEKDFADDDALKAYYAKDTAWPEDTALIRRLTPEGGKAAVLSSYEILLLQKADRKPFFYYFPVINSRPLTGRNFMVTCLFCYPQIQKLLDQLETEKPQYIFMERIFLTPQVPEAYAYEYDDLFVLLRYIFANYQPSEAGKYLVAMKRK